jgi:hypothetical protein
MNVAECHYPLDALKGVPRDLGECRHQGRNHPGKIGCFSHEASPSLSRYPHENTAIFEITQLLQTFCRFPDKVGLTAITPEEL